MDTPTMDRLVETLQTVSLFAGLPREVVARLASEVEEIHARAGEAVVTKGESGDAMYVVVDGALEATVDGQGGPVAIAAFGPGDWFGEMALITGDPRSTTVATLSDCLLLHLSKTRFMSLCDRYPIFLLEVARTLCRRLVRASDSLAHAQRIYENIFEGMLSACDEEERELLFRLTLAERPHPDVLEELPGCSDAANRLSGLARRHPALLIQREDGSYLLHHGLRQHLHAQLLRAHDGSTVAGIHAALAAACQARGESRGALLHWLEAGRPNEAADLLREMLASPTPPNDDDLGAWLERIPATALIESGLIEARAHWLRRRERSDEAVALYREALTLTPRRSEARRKILTALADEYFRRGEADRAGACLTEVDGGEGSRLVPAPQPFGPRDLAAGGAEAAYALARSARTLADALREMRSPFVQRLRFVRGWSGLLVALAAGGLVLLLPPPGLSRAAVSFVAVLVTGTVLWVRGQPPDYVVALGMGVAWVLLRVAPPQLAFSGFASSTWFLVLGVLGLSAALARSGLLYRTTLQIVRRFPATFAGQAVALAAAGVVSTLFVPSVTARVALMGPIVLGMSDTLKYPPRSRGTTGLALAGFAGACLATAIFLTGTATCVTAWRVLPDATRAEITWIRWLTGALLVEGGTLVAALAWIVWRYRPRDAQVAGGQLVEAQLKLLGPWRREEVITAVLAILLVIVWSSQPWHGVDPAWFAVAALCVLIAARVLDRTALQTQIDWPFLIFMGMVFSLADLGLRVGAADWLGRLTAEHLGSLRHPAAVILMALLVTFLARFVLPWQTAAPLLVVALVPLMQHAGLSPWIAVLVALKAGNVFLLPSQNVYYLAYYYGTEQRAFTHEAVRPFAWAYAGMILVAFLLSLPYWYALGFAR